MIHVGGLVQEYVAERVRKGQLAESSVGVIEPMLLQWTRHAGPDPMAWTVEQLEHWVYDQRIRPAYAKSRLTKLRPFLRWLDRRELVDRRFAREADDMESPRVPAGAPRDFADDEVAALMRQLPDARAVLIVILMLQMGLRCGDVARIRIEDIDVRRRLLHVRAKNGRGMHTHWEPITEEAWDLLMSWVRSTRRSAGPLICSYQRPGHALRPSSIGDLVAEWIAAAGLKHFPYDGRTPHALRHTMAQGMLDRGADLREVQYALGHDTIRSTEYYARREPAGLRAAMEGRRYAA